MEKPIIEAGNEINVTCTKVAQKEGVDVFHIQCELKDKPEVEMVSLSWQIPYLDAAGIWRPNCGFNRSIDADWEDFTQSATASSAPIMCIFSEGGENRVTIALSETKEIMKMRAGIHEEDGTLQVKIGIPVSNIIRKKSYCFEIRIDTIDVPFYQSIQKVSQWWQEECGILPSYVPQKAKEPVYSTWYAYHQELQDIEIEKECELASNLGFQTVILDDGWQTEDNNRGYSFCGDWQISNKKFPDFANHIKKVKELGMNYMIWYSVPFLGDKTQKWEEFQDKLLYSNNHSSIRAGVLDPRYKEVRDYLTGIYVRALEEWDIDGLKLDFIDSIYERPETPAYNAEKMDFESVQEALDCLMNGVYQVLSDKKKDIMVEFRQGYIGPNMRRYGNMFRVSDCPNSAIRNRVGIVDLRMLCGNTAVHSDPLMWHVQEKPELAAIQIISSIFATVQISVKMQTLSNKMQAMLKFWISFMRENQELLQDVPICAIEPHNLYPIVWTQKEGKAIIAVYSDSRVLRLPKGMREGTILNGTTGTEIVLQTERGIKNVVVKDCCGRTVTESQYYVEGEIHTIKVPIAGQICWKEW